MAVTNDLITDNRVHKMAVTLHELGYSITLIGRVKPESAKVTGRVYQTHRFKLPFLKGPLFYASYNLTLCFYLLSRSFSVIWSNDLDTLPACFLVSKIKRSILVYDSHELYTEVPELVNRPGIRKIWEKIEGLLVPRLKYCITVCQSIASYYLDKYGTTFMVVRNVPVLGDLKTQTKEALSTTNGKPVILYQGSVNLGRGVEEAISAMHFIDEAELWIVGDGDHYRSCIERVHIEGLSHKVHFTGRIPLEDLSQYTKRANIGLSLEKDLGLNYRYALPNKLFDYIRAGVPVLASALPEIKKIIDNYQIGNTIEEISPRSISSAILSMLNDKEKMEDWSSNCLKAAPLLCWEKEQEIVIEFMQKIKSVYPLSEKN